MEMSNQFAWVDFYKEFAAKLLAYKNDRKALIEKVEAIYSKTSMSMPTLERRNELIDIDPFTVFGLFNKKLTDKNRILILEAIAELFGVNTPVPTSFDSLPVLNPQNATFYYFVDERAEEDIDELWGLYEAALQYAAEPTEARRSDVSHYFDLAINKKGNGNSKITMGLYWISPNSFLNLDSRNEWYIYKSGKIPADVIKELPLINEKISGSDYFKIVGILRNYLNSDASKLKDFKELSYEAWSYSEEVNRINRENRLKGGQKPAIDNGESDAVRYWLYAPGPNSSKWDEFYEAGIMAIGWGDIGDLRSFKTKEDMKVQMRKLYDPESSFKNQAHATWQFVHDMKIGDIIFVKKGLRQLVGLGKVISDYEYDLTMGDNYNNIRRVQWLYRGEWAHPGQAAIKTLTDITPYTEYVEELKALILNELAPPDEIKVLPASVKRILQSA